MKTYVITNPHSGTADDQALRGEFEQRGDVTLRMTAQENDARRFAEQALAEGYELIVAAGGDGTINEVVNGMAADFGRATLGVIPLGTGNDFARSINMPAGVAEALATLDAGITQAVDIVRVTSDQVRYFINVSSGGFSGLVDETLTPEMKQSWGPLAYLRSAMAALPDLSEYHMQIAFDEEEALDIKAFNVVVANARYVAGGIPIAPQAVLDDGLMDVLIVPAASMPQLALLAPQILLGAHLDSDLITFRRARKVLIESHPGMWFNTDGELVGNEPAVFEVLPRALRVIVGPDAVGPS